MKSSLTHNAKKEMLVAATDIIVEAGAHRDGFIKRVDCGKMFLSECRLLDDMKCHMHSAHGFAIEYVET